MVYYGKTLALDDMNVGKVLDGSQKYRRLWQFDCSAERESAHNLLNFYKFNFSTISGEWTEGLKSNRQCRNGEW